MSMNEIFRRQNSPAISSPSFSCFAIKYLLVIPRELWWTNQNLLEKQIGSAIDQKLSRCKGRLVRRVLKALLTLLAVYISTFPLFH
jgi:hypothetical protein